jgi:curved DNA-binding protein
VIYCLLHAPECLENNVQTAGTPTSVEPYKHREKYLNKANVRKEERAPSKQTYCISWSDGSGVTHSTQVQGTDFSPSGIGVLSAIEVPPGTRVYIQAQGETPIGYSVVRHCTPRDNAYLIGLELDEVAKKAREPVPRQDATDHYEFLQISPNAQPETIQRVYRFLAARFHPDNTQTGDPEKFLLLNQAFEVLSDPERRAEYDANLRKKQTQPSPVFESVDFLDGIEGEVNRRLAVLSLLYRRCRANVHDPKISLRDLETAMGFPREYLDFTTWYLKTKKYITREDNSDFALTALGVDYVESNSSKLPMLCKLLNAGRPSDTCSGQDVSGAPDPTEEVLIAGPSEATTEDLPDSE